MAKRPAPKSKPETHHAHHGRARELRTLAHVLEFLIELEEQIMAVSQKVSDALAAQDQKISDLSAKVDAFVASHQSASAADDQAVTDKLAAQGAAVDAIAAKLV